MKKTILITGILLLVFNTVAGLILSDYKPFNYIAVDISVMLTTALLFGLSCSQLSNGYKIGLSYLFLLTGIGRCCCLAVASSVWKDNNLFLVALGLLLFEIVCIAVAKFVGG